MEEKKITYEDLNKKYNRIMMKIDGYKNEKNNDLFINLNDKNNYIMINKIMNINRYKEINIRY